MFDPAAPGAARSNPRYTLPKRTGRARGRWGRLAKIGLEQYFVRTVETGQTEPCYERLALKPMGIDKLKVQA